MLDGQQLFYSCFLFYFKEIKLTIKSTNKERRRIWDCGSDVVAHGGECDFFFIVKQKLKEFD